METIKNNKKYSNNKYINNFCLFFINIFNIFYKKWRNIKNKINPKIGAKVYKTFTIILISLFFIVMPIFLTVFSTLTGYSSSNITANDYKIIQYSLFAIIGLTFLIWLFFKEFKIKK